MDVDSADEGVPLRPVANPRPRKRIRTEVPPVPRTCIHPYPFPEMQDAFQRLANGYTLEKTHPVFDRLYSLAFHVVQPVTESSGLGDWPRGVEAAQRRLCMSCTHNTVPCSVAFKFRNALRHIAYVVLPRARAAVHKRTVHLLKKGFIPNTPGADTDEPHMWLYRVLRDTDDHAALLYSSRVSDPAITAPFFQRFMSLSEFPYTTRDHRRDKVSTRSQVTDPPYASPVSLVVSNRNCPLRCNDWESRKDVVVSELCWRGRQRFRNPAEFVAVCCMELLFSRYMQKLWDVANEAMNLCSRWHAYEIVKTVGEVPVRFTSMSRKCKCVMERWYQVDQFTGQTDPIPHLRDDQEVTRERPFWERALGCSLFQLSLKCPGPQRCVSTEEEHTRHLGTRDRRLELVTSVHTNLCRKVGCPYFRSQPLPATTRIEYQWMDYPIPTPNTKVAFVPAYFVAYVLQYLYADLRAYQYLYRRFYQDHVDAKPPAHMRQTVFHPHGKRAKIRKVEKPVKRRLSCRCLPRDILECIRAFLVPPGPLIPPNLNWSRVPLLRGRAELKCMRRRVQDWMEPHGAPIRNLSDGLPL